MNKSQSLGVSANRQPHSDRRAAHKALAVICLGIVLSMASWFSATAVTVDLVRIWKLDATASAALTNSVQFGFVVGAALAAMISLPDIMATRLLMAGGAVVASISNAVLLLSPTYEIALVARVTTGMALAAVYPPALKLIATWFVRGRGLALGLAIAALTVGSASPHLLSSLSSHLDWHLVIVGSSAFTLLGGLILGRFGHDGPFPFQRAQFDLCQIRQVLCNRKLNLINLGYLGHMWELYAMWTWFLTYVTAIAPRLANWSSAQLSLLTFFVIASGVIGCAGGGILADRIGRPAVAIGMMSVSGACAALVGFSAQFGAIPFLAISFLWGISVIGDSAQFSAMTSEQADTHLVGTALTVQMAGGFAMTILSIRLIPWIAGEIGWQWVFIFLAPPPLAGAISIFYAAKSGAGPAPGRCSSKLGKRSARW